MQVDIGWLSTFYHQTRQQVSCTGFQCRVMFVTGVGDEQHSVTAPVNVRSVSIRIWSRSTRLFSNTNTFFRHWICKKPCFCNLKIYMHCYAGKLWMCWLGSSGINFALIEIFYLAALSCSGWQKFDSLVVSLPDFVVVELEQDKWLKLLFFV